MSYRIVRHYSRTNPRDGLRGHLETKRRTVDSGPLTLEEAQFHCSRADTSSLSGTAKRKAGGWDWFDGYEER